jgi:hypothetical protein
MFRLTEPAPDAHAVPSRRATATGSRSCRASSRPGRPAPGVPCHNDLLAENYLDDGELWIVDYEQRQRDPTFELGNTARSSVSTGPDHRAVRLLRPGDAGTAGADAPPDDHVGHGLDAMGGHQARIDDRLRLLGLGRGALGTSRAGHGPSSQAGCARSVRGPETATAGPGPGPSRACCRSIPTDHPADLRTRTPR